MKIGSVFLREIANRQTNREGQTDRQTYKHRYYITFLADVTIALHAYSYSLFQMKFTLS